MASELLASRSETRIMKMAKLGFGLSAQTLAICGIDENQIMRDMQEGCYLVNDVLPEQHKSKKTRNVWI